MLTRLELERGWAFVLPRASGRDIEVCDMRFSRASVAITRASLAAVAAAAFFTGCGDSGSSAAGDASATAAPVPGFGDGPVADRIVSSILDDIASCDIDHRGLLVDLGTPMMRGRVVLRGEGNAPLEDVEHHGATWSIVDNRTMELTFVLPEPSRLFVSANVQPIGARRVSFYIDDQSVGSVRLKGEDPRVVTTDPTELPFDAGEHTLVARFSPARVKEAHAHVDWIRVGTPDEIRNTYGPPTLGDLVQADAALARVPHRALRLKTPTTVRCPLRVPKGARFRTALGVLGGKEGTAEIAVRVDGRPPTLLLQKALKGGEEAVWEDVDVSLDPFAGQLVTLELRTAGAPGAGRVLFGDPAVLVSTAEPPATPAAQIVVLVVMSGLDRAELPGYSDRPKPHLERFTKLAESSALFVRHRASTNVVPGNVATLLTGLPPEVHSVVDYGSALPKSVPTLAQKAHDAAIQTALFTGVPHSFEPVGFSRGLSKFVEVSPIEGEQRDALAEAATWLETTLTTAPTAKILLVVHARGGHPPWTVPPKQLDLLPPENYTGDINPRRAAQQLAMLRRKSARADLSDQDMIRLGAFYQLALLNQDRALGQLLDVLEDTDLADKSLVVVTGDLSSGLSTLFADAPAFEERTLELPLYVRFPDQKLAGRRVEAATGVEDVATTLAIALGLKPSTKVWGRDLAHIGSGAALVDQGPSFALFGDAYSVRWESLILREKVKTKGALCDLSFDPTCAFDRRQLLPFATSALSRSLAAYEDSLATARHQHEPLVLDDDTLAALRVWGSMQ